MPGTWGYVQGGMGMVSFLLCDIAREAGAVVAAGVPVARIVPGEGVELESGERIPAPQRGLATPIRGRRSRCSGDVGRPGVGRAGAGGPDRGRDGQGEHDADRAPQLHRPARHRASRTTPAR